MSFSLSSVDHVCLLGDARVVMLDFEDLARHIFRVSHIPEISLNEYMKQHGVQDYQHLLCNELTAKLMIGGIQQTSNSHGKHMSKVRSAAKVHELSAEYNSKLASGEIITHHEISKDSISHLSDSGMARMRNMKRHAERRYRVAARKTMAA